MNDNEFRVEVVAEMVVNFRDAANGELLGTFLIVPDEEEEQ